MQIDRTWVWSAYAGARIELLILKLNGSLGIIGSIDRRPMEDVDSTQLSILSKARSADGLSSLVSRLTREAGSQGIIWLFSAPSQGR